MIIMDQSDSLNSQQHLLNLIAVSQRILVPQVLNLLVSQPHVDKEDQDHKEVRDHKEVQALKEVQAHYQKKLIKQLVKLLADLK